MCNEKELSDLEHSRLMRKFLQYDQNHRENETFAQWLKRMREEGQ